MNRRLTLSCSFCGKDQNEVKKLIAGPNVYICDACTGLCSDILDEEETAPGTQALNTTPAALLELLTRSLTVAIGLERSLFDRKTPAGEVTLGHVFDWWDRAKRPEADALVPVELHEACEKLQSGTAFEMPDIHELDFHGIKSGVVEALNFDRELAIGAVAFPLTWKDDVGIVAMSEPKQRERVERLVPRFVGENAPKIFLVKASSRSIQAAIGKQWPET